jgi:hypothetical protein
LLRLPLHSTTVSYMRSWSSLDSPWIHLFRGLDFRAFTSMPKNLTKMQEIALVINITVMDKPNYETNNKK